MIFDNVLLNFKVSGLQFSKKGLVFMSFKVISNFSEVIGIKQLLSLISSE